MTPKQARFVEEYLTDFNATQAAIRAGYSEKTAYQVGSENLRKPEIAAAIAEGRERHSQKAAVTVQHVLNGLLMEATREGEGSSHSARVSAWGQLGKFMGLAERLEHTGPDGKPIQTESRHRWDMDALKGKGAADLARMFAEGVRKK